MNRGITGISNPTRLVRMDFNWGVYAICIISVPLKKNNTFLMLKLSKNAFCSNRQYIGEFTAVAIINLVAVSVDGPMGGHLGYVQQHARCMGSFLLEEEGLGHCVHQLAQHFYIKKQRHWRKLHFCRGVDTFVLILAGLLQVVVGGWTMLCSWESSLLCVSQHTICLLACVFLSSSSVQCELLAPV